LDGINPGHRVIAKTIISTTGSQTLRFSSIRRDGTPTRLGDKPVNELFEVVHEDPDLLVVNKPAGLVCHPTKTDERSSLIGRVRLHLGHGEGRLVNRLDRETSGLVLVAKSSGVAGELGKLMESGAVQKRYDAIVEGFVASDEFTINAALGKDEHSDVAIKDCVRPDGAAAQTNVRLLKRFLHETREFSLLHIQPRSGRKHQIRIHLAHAGHPIVGDKLYGADEQIYLRFVTGALSESDRRQLILSNHALHAARLQFRWRNHDWVFSAKPSDEFRTFAELEQAHG
jgi:23S rRNA pseudouridine1911/1915/1917 synthase